MYLIELLAEHKYISIDQKREIHNRFRDSTLYDVVDYLLLNDIVDKSVIMKILSEVTGVPFINLSGMTIDKYVADLIPPEFAWENNICPIEFNSNRNSLKVACLNPKEENLIDKIRDISKIDNIEFYVTYKTNLHCALIENYRYDEKVNSITDSIKDNKQETDYNDNFELSKPGIIVLTPDSQFNKKFWEAIVNIGYDVYIFDNSDDVEQLFHKRKILKLFIRSNDKDPFNTLVNKFKLVNPSGSVGFYSSEDDLLFKTNKENIHFNLIKDSFKLMKITLSNETENIVEQVNEVAEVAEQLCSKLSVSEYINLITISAAYLYDFSTFYVENSITRNSAKEIIRLSVGYLKTSNYTPQVCDVLELMYKDVDIIDENDELSLSANIVTAADYICHYNHLPNKLSIDEFIQLKENIRSNIGKMFLPEVAQALIDLLYDRIDISFNKNQSCYVLVYNESGEDRLMLEKCLENLGFKVDIVPSLELFINSFNEQRPDIIVIQGNREIEKTINIVNQISESDIKVDNITTYLLTDNKSDFEINSLYQKGIEDIFSTEDDIDLFIIKIIRARKRIFEKPKQRLEILEGMGTFGSLTDMNLIDLLQAMNASRKTCLINITALGEQLTIYIKQGLILFAECGDLKGEQAIYKSLMWDKGMWSVDPIIPKEIPKSNINKSIDSILLEGCHFLDESKKDEANDVSVESFNLPE